MPIDPWNPPTQRVQFRLQPTTPPGDDAKFLLIDDARNGYVVGILTMNYDELQVLQQAITGTRAGPGVSTNFAEYMRVRVVTNPMNYIINGKRLDQVPIAQRWDMVYASYLANLPAAPFALSNPNPP